MAKPVTTVEKRTISAPCAGPKPKMTGQKRHAQATNRRQTNKATESHRTTEIKHNREPEDSFTDMVNESSVHHVTNQDDSSSDDEHVYAITSPHKHPHVTVTVADTPTEVIIDSVQALI